jgi:hypothetical protein
MPSQMTITLIKSTYSSPYPLITVIRSMFFCWERCSIYFDKKSSTM